MGDQNLPGTPRPSKTKFLFRFSSTLVDSSSAATRSTEEIEEGSSDVLFVLGRYRYRSAQGSETREARIGPAEPRSTSRSPGPRAQSRYDFGFPPKPDPSSPGPESLPVAGRCLSTETPPQVLRIDARRCLSHSDIQVSNKMQRSIDRYKNTDHKIEPEGYEYWRGNPGKQTKNLKGPQKLKDPALT